MLKGFYKTLLSISFVVYSTCSYAADKVALIIGNSEYKSVADNLKNPVNDAKSLQKILQAAGYQTNLVLNANLDTMLSSLDKAKEQVDAGGTLVFYYAGHGVQADNQNFLVPTNAQLSNKDKVSREAVSLQEIIEKLQTSSAAAKILIIDACRNDPFPKTYRSGTRGLVRMQPPARGLMVMYAASPGEVAQDGKGRNGTFTGALLDELNQPNQRLTDLMDNVVDKVRVATGGQQNPYYEGTGLSKLVLIGQSQTNLTPINTVTMPSSSGIGGEDIFWQSIINSQDIEDFQEYLNRYPNGSYVYLAEKKIKQFNLMQDKKREDEAWAKAQANLSEKALEEFMALFPNSIYVAEASSKLAALGLEKQQKLDENLWRETKNSTRSQDFDFYIKQFPQGKYSVLAKEKYQQYLADENLQKDENKWNAILHSTNYQDFEAYLTDFPVGKYRIQAKQLADRYKKLFDLEERAWRLIEKSTSPADFEKFLQLYATGFYSEKAKEKLKDTQVLLEKEQELKAKEQALKTQDEDLWKQTKSVWTLVNLQKYMEKFPNGLHTQEAQAGIDELKRAQADKQAKEKEKALWQKISNSKDPKDFILYLSLYPQGVYASQATKQQEKLEAEQLKVLDEQTWNIIKDKTDIQLFRNYLKDFGNGQYVSDAKKQIKKLEELLSNQKEEDYWQLIKEKTEAKVFADYLVEFPTGKYVPEAQALVAKYTVVVGSTVVNIKNVRDCANCPDMVIVPKGSFLMGSTTDKTQHLVTINKPLAVAKYELTVGEYNQCVKDNACYKAPKTGSQTDQHPVSGLRWQDAKNYINWLSNKAKRVYRLPTEAEWEYFARANTKTTWSFGDDQATICQYGNIADETYNRVFSSGDTSCADNQAGSSSVGLFKPNAFGLYDTIGNVYEWVEDCFVDNYQAAPTDGTAAFSKQCDKRVLRGGAYAVSAAKASSASRLAAEPDDAFYLNGVRLVRDVKEGEY